MHKESGKHVVFNIIEIKAMQKYESREKCQFWLGWKFRFQKLLELTRTDNLDEFTVFQLIHLQFIKHQKQSPTEIAKKVEIFKSKMENGKWKIKNFAHLSSFHYLLTFFPNKYHANEKQKKCGKIAGLQEDFFKLTINWFTFE